MAEKKCPSCKMMIDKGAKICPHCRKKFGMSGCGLFIIAVFVLFMIGIISAINTGQHISQKTTERRAALTPAQKAKEDASNAKEERLSKARSACDFYLTQSLNDPDSAKLNPRRDWPVSERKDGSILVQPAGRANNAFGAYIYGVWNCVVKIEHGNARVISLKQVRP